MNANRGGGYGPLQMALASAQSTGLPVCAIVVAAYRVSTLARRRRAGEPRTASRRRGPTGPTSPRRGVSNGRDGPRCHRRRQPQRVTRDRAMRSRRRAAPEARPRALTTTVDAGPVPRHPGHRREGGRLRHRAALLRALPARPSASSRPRPWPASCSTSRSSSRRCSTRGCTSTSPGTTTDEAIGMTTLTRTCRRCPGSARPTSPTTIPSTTRAEPSSTSASPWCTRTTRARHVFHAMIEPMCRARHRPARRSSAWDMCLVNDERGLGGSAGRLLEQLADVTIVPIDRQTYYAATFHGPRENASALTSPGLLPCVGLPRVAKGVAMTVPTVLVVDDDDDIRDLTQLALETVDGWNVLTAGGGAAAIESRPRAPARRGPARHDDARHGRAHDVRAPAGRRRRPVTSR